MSFNNRKNSLSLVHLLGKIEATKGLSTHQVTLLNEAKDRAFDLESRLEELRKENNESKAILTKYREAQAKLVNN